MRLRSVAAIVATCGATSVASADFFNGSFEDGNFGTGAPAFAGGTARNLVNRSPDGWAYAGSQTGNTDRWVTSSAAQDGQRFIYMSAFNPYPNNDCLLGKPCFEKGETFTISAWAASASLLPGTNRMNFEFREYLEGGGVLDTVYSFDLPANPAWSDSALSVIPWLQYSINHTYAANANDADFWITATQSANGTTSSIVFDNAECSKVPAPSAAIVLGLGALVGTRRRRA
jgi:hypothetical protein